MGLHQEVQASRLAGKGLQHGRNPAELQEKLCTIYPLLPLTVFRPAGYNGRII